MSLLTPAAGRVQRAAAPTSFGHIARRPAHRRLIRGAHVRWLAAVANETADTQKKSSLACELSIIFRSEPVR